MKQYIKKGEINEEYSACKFTLQQQTKNRRRTRHLEEGRNTFIQTNDVRWRNMGLKKVKKHTKIFEITNSELLGWSAAEEKDKKVKKKTIKMN